MSLFERASLRYGFLFILHNLQLRLISQVDRNLLYHYLPVLEAYGTKLSDNIGQDEADLKHLNLLLDFLKSEYASTTARLTPLLKTDEITYDLLWALFRPKTFFILPVLTLKKPYASDPIRAKRRCRRPV